MADVIPPDTRAAGQAGHLQDHNDTADVLTDHENRLGAMPSSQGWGLATLVAGTVTVTSPFALSTSVILVTRMAPAGTLGFLAVSAITSGVSFTVTSSSASDASQISYLILNT